MKRTTKQWISLSMTMLMAANAIPAGAIALQDPVPVVSTTTAENSGLIDFRNCGGGTMDIDEATRSITLSDTNGDHFAMYNGLEKKAKAFTLEADVEFTKTSDESPLSAALVFGTSSKKTPNTGWYGANIDTRRIEASDLFRVFGSGIDTNKGGEKRDINVDEKLHLKISVEQTGEFVYSFGNTGAAQYEITGTIPGWSGGYVGILSFCSETVFSNISFEDRTDHTQVTTEIPADARFNTNLEHLSSVNGEWNITDAGLHSNAVDKGDCFVLSETRGSNFVYSTDVSFQSESGAAALVFRSNNDLDNKESYAVNLDISSHKCKFWRWQEDQAMQLMNEKEIDATEDETYTLKVVAYDTWISCYVNDEMVASTGDYTNTWQKDDKGQNTVIKSGAFGLLNWNGEMTFQNTRYTELSQDFNPLLNDITVTSSTGTIEEKSQFTPTEPVNIQYVGNDASTVDISVKKANEKTAVTVSDADGKVYADGKNIPVKVGSNIITVTSTAENKDSTTATLTYRVNVHRRDADEVYYNEAYRDQYHYSVKDGWANDPNGLVYYNGTYHMFYQFYDDTKWGPMHWAHATSTDLIHWEEQPIALYPDANGAMFSGCIVADEQNTSGLFADGKGGLVALITADGNGQRIKLAYSADEGKTWTKVDDIAADWTDDPLGNRDFRDPKVFRWEDKWFMVVAGGPLRIYSSDNLKDWTCESTYANLHTECPDLYPVQLEDGTVKWVLSRGGRYYKIGDFKQIDGNWQFVPDDAYKESDGVMNFGRDSYAAMTYYVQDFGTSKNPTIPDVIELNWMNTWDDYCNQVADKVGQNFNGTFNLNLKTGVTKENGKYLLTQTPIQAYETLRDTKNATVLKDVEVTEDNTLLKDFSGDCYEIVSTFTPGADTKKVGFNLRVGEGTATRVIYDLETETLSIDRSKSGTIISDKFAEVNSQKVTKNADGTIDLHIYVDRASVEVFSKDNTVAGANQLFPAADSLGASVLVEGGAAKADITIYPMNSIWKASETPTTKPVTEVFTDVAPNGWYVPYVQYAYDNGLMVGMDDATFGPNLPMSRAMLAQILYNQAGTPAVSGKDAFTDVKKDAWYYDAVQWASQQGIVAGVGHGKYAPESNITREQFARILHQHAGAPKVSGSLKFADKNQVSGWAAQAMLWANQNDIINGRKDGKKILLCPKDNATRAEGATMLTKYFEKK